MPTTRLIRVGPDAGSDAGAGGDRIGRGHVRVGAVVDIEVMGLCALEQHHLVRIECFVEHPADVDHVRPDPLGVRQQVLGDLHRVERPPVVDLDQQVVLLFQRGLDLQAQQRLVEQILDPQPDPVDLVRVRRADPATGGADLGLAQEPLGDLVDHLVVAGDDVRVGRDDHVRGVHPAGGQPGDLAEQHVEVDHDPVADHRNALGVEDAGREQVQRIPLAAHHDGVAGVVTPGVADAVVDPVAQLVGGLALALVAPLRSHHHNARHVVAALRKKSEAPGAFAAGTLAT